MSLQSWKTQIKQSISDYENVKPSSNEDIQTLSALYTLERELESIPYDEPTDQLTVIANNLTSDIVPYLRAKNSRSSDIVVDSLQRVLDDNKSFISALWGVSTSGERELIKDHVLDMVELLGCRAKPPQTP